MGEWLFGALALMLVLEGLLPFLSPPAVKRAFAQMISLPDGVLRLVGLSSMLAGCGLLYLIRG